MKKEELTRFTMEGGVVLISDKKQQEQSQVVTSSGQTLLDPFIHIAPKTVYQELGSVWVVLKGEVFGSQGPIKVNHIV